MSQAEFAWMPRYVYCWTRESCSEDYPSPGPGWEFAGSRIEPGSKDNDPPYRVTRWRRPEEPLSYGRNMEKAEDPWTSIGETKEVKAPVGRAQILQLLGR